MPCLSGEYKPDIGVLLQVGIFPPGTARATNAENTDAVHVAGVFALADTGASRTSISTKLATDMGLQSAGRMAIQGATGEREVDCHFVDLVLGFGSQSIVIGNLEVFEIDPVNAPFDVLVGRDILCRGVFTMDFSGRFTFSI